MTLNMTNSRMPRSTCWAKSTANPSPRAGCGACRTMPSWNASPFAHPWRGHGIGSEITRLLLRLARERGYSSYRMNAQAYLQEYYGRFGFRAAGESFMEAGIEHVVDGSGGLSPGGYS